MISANGLAYFTADSGYITVVKPGPELEIVAQSQIGEEVYASPAIFGNQLFIRGEENLFCIGK
jgi:hypothetical protein